MTSIVATLSNLLNLPNPPGKLEALLYPDYVVTEITAAPEGGLELHLQPTALPICPRCGKPSLKLHETRHRRIREAPFPGCSAVWISLPIRRVRCKCGCHAQESIPWLIPYKRMTARLIAHIQYRVRADVATSLIARDLGVSWETVRDLDEAQLKMFFSDVRPSPNIRRIMIDEIALLKGHRYITIFMDYDDRKIFFIVIGKSKEAIRPGFERLVELGLAGQIEAVACDMNGSYPPLVKEYLPNADIVYDYFHVMKLTSDGLCKEARQLQAKQIEEEYGKDSQQAQSMRRNLRRAEYVIISRPETLKPEARERLDELLRHNQILGKVHPLLALIRNIWETYISDEARESLAEAIELLRALRKEYGMETAERLAKTLEDRAEGILSACKHHISTSPLEGANNRAKVLKRVAFGYRKIEFFILKLKAAFPGKGWNTWKRLGPWDCVIGDRVIDAGLSLQR